jgi:hypothetical protein
MVSTDSGPRHIAAALGKPVVTLFGPMLPIATENPTQTASNLILQLDCIGCGKRACPLGDHSCMRNISVDTVYAAAIKLLAESSRRGAVPELASSGSGGKRLVANPKLHRHNGRMAVTSSLQRGKTAGASATAASTKAA